MGVTVSQVQGSQPQTLIDAGKNASTKAQQVENLLDQVKSKSDTAATHLKGSTQEAREMSIAGLRLGGIKVVDQLTDIGQALEISGHDLVSKRKQVLDEVAEANGKHLAVADDGTATPTLCYDDDDKEKQIEQDAKDYTTRIQDALTDFDTAQQQASESLNGQLSALDGIASGVSNVVDPGIPLAPPAQDSGTQIPNPGTDPNAVKSWWDSLAKPQRDQLLREHPEMLGNLDGIYVADRSKANTTVMRQDLDRVTNAASSHHVSVEEVTAHPQNYGLTARDVTRYTNAVQTKKGLDDNSSKTHGAPTFLQVYEPDKFGGKGRVEIAIGDPDARGAKTAVVVPGTSNSVTGGWLSHDDAANLYNETLAANHGQPTSVVAWMGYDAPNSLIDPRVGQTALAHQGAALLASDVNTLNVTHQGASDITVIGHSYGSTTVADAAAGYGMHANNAVLIGCPGTDMAHSAADFHLAPGGHVFVGSASTDPVTQFGAIPQTHIPGTDTTVALGADPAAEGFGSTRFKAEVPGYTTYNDHSHYNDLGSESLYNMADIASGHGDALESHGMTAEHRGTVLSRIVTQIIAPEFSGLPASSDPEMFRPGTGGHHHILPTPEPPPTPAPQPGPTPSPSHQ